jgi:RNA polymerase sigma-70 factor (ECF subfamily)
VDDVDEATVIRFVEQDYARVVNAVALVAGSTAAAEDAVQEALARAWVRSRRGEPIASLPSWVAVVAMNHARSGWRRILAERRSMATLEGSLDASSPADRDATADVRRAVASLPRRQREVAVLRYLLDMSTREVAEALGVGEGTVKNSLSKARSTLAARLAIADEENEEAPRDVQDR